MSTKGEQSESGDSLVEILGFTRFSRFFRFNHTGEIGCKKRVFMRLKSR